MKNLNLTSKIFLYLAALSGGLWLGSYLTRLILSYQIFEGIDFTLRTYINNQNLPAIFVILDASTILTSLLYTAFIIFFILFLVTSRMSLRQNGWLFIISMIIFLTLPFEAYLMSIDYKTFLLVNSGSFDTAAILSLYIKRFKILGSFPIIEILCYFSVLFFALFRPLKKKIQKPNEN
ncbi:MAG: hypothetical protein ACYCVH_09195 [Ignavibacteriaceae bacterium]